MSKTRIDRGTHHLGELRNQAKTLQEERATRSPKQQLAVLDRRLGPGIGAEKERKKLQVLIDAPKPKKQADKVKSKKKGKK